MPERPANPNSTSFARKGPILPLRRMLFRLAFLAARHALHTPSHPRSVRRASLPARHTPALPPALARGTDACRAQGPTPPGRERLGPA